LGSYSAAFSPGAGFYVLSYKGPNVPWQRVVKTDDPSAWHAERDELSDCAFLLTVSLLGFDFVVEDNVALNATWSRFETPIVQYTTIDSDGYGEISTNLPFLK
jgi:dipeptidyl aminopeptidase